MLGGLSRRFGGLTRNLCRRPGRDGEFVSITLKLTRRIQDLLDNPPDFCTESIDKLIEFRLALLHRLLFSADAFSLKLASLDAVIFKHSNCSSDHPDFVMAIGVLD